MKKIIDGKKYDTETAKLIAEWSYGNSSDYRYICEELYLTRKGNWFIFGEGGSGSIYGEQVGSTTFSGGEKIVLIDEEDAKKFIEKHGDSETYEHFFEVEEA
ncbi:hypothetical protein [Enterococcus sp. HY326]|uniref:hypothetical protein n=1 Tax=Enterococcus sp. HY326 TaxID=2971265 RepID=UPI00223FC5D0|nr:hypothetical protein [Enterococcus sp. HY326]